MNRFITSASQQLVPNRFPEFVLGCLIVYKAGDFPFWPLHVTVSEVAAILLVVLAACRPPQTRPGDAAWLAKSMQVFLSWVAVVAVVTEVFSVTRAGHLSLWVLVALSVASGRISLESFAKGMGLGVVIGFVYGAIFLGASSYQGRLTGIFGDPNTAGMIIVTSTAVCFGVIKRPTARWVIGGAGMAAIVLTQSRTTLFASLVVITWSLVGHRVNRWVGGIALTVVIWAVSVVGESGVASDFSEGREGSDALRIQIIDAELAKLSASPLMGHGMGEGVIYVAETGRSFLFHNSYFAAVAEFGLVGVGIILLLVATAYLRSAGDRSGRRSLWLEGALIAALICAQHLGEVLFAFPLAIALGAIARNLVMDGSKAAVKRTAYYYRGKL